MFFEVIVRNGLKQYVQITAMRESVYDMYAYCAVHTYETVLVN